MPFTISHIVAAVPLRWLGLPLLPLAIGCMAPDFFYFIPRHLGGDISHTIPGMFLAALPAAYVTLVLFQYFLRTPLLLLLPVRHQALATALTAGARPGSFWARPWGTAVLLLTGIATHLAWDSFTHLRGTMVQKLPFLAETSIDTPLGSVELYKLLQHGSSGTGLAALAAGYLWLFCRRQQTPTPATIPAIVQLPTRIRRRVRLTICAITASAFAGEFHWQWGYDGKHDRIWEAVTAGGMALLAASIVYCLLWHWQSQGARRGG